VEMCVIMNMRLGYCEGSSTQKRDLAELHCEEVNS
jgi:hypothetical protein